MKAILVGKVEYFLKRKNLLEKNVNLKEMILFEQGLTMCFNTFGAMCFNFWGFPAAISTGDGWFTFKTRYRPMNFVMLPKYYIGKILPI